MLAALVEFVLDRQLQAQRVAQAQRARQRPLRRPRPRTPVKTMIPNLERFVKQAAERLFCCEFRKVRPGWLTSPLTGHRLELDLYNAELRLAIEVQGAGHARFISKFHKSYADFEAQQIRDHMKRRLCKERGVLLIEVPHSTRRAELDELLLTAWQGFSPPALKAFSLRDEVSHERQT